jgi:ADP-ribose pyrophosphatase YjhB (NUDIX family)
VSGIILVEKNGKYLLVKEGWGECFGKWSLPGGEQEVKEDIFTCAKREGKEETGFVFNLLSIVGFYQQHLNYLNEDILGVTFAAEIIGGEENLMQETLEIGYFSKSEIQEMVKNKLLRFSDALRIIEDYESGKRFPLSCVTVL